jgi:hypothetical protein
MIAIDRSSIDERSAALQKTNLQRLLFYDLNTSIEYRSNEKHSYSDAKQQRYPEQFKVI